MYDKCVCLVQPVSRVVDHLKERHRRYLSLKTPAVHLTPPLMSRYVCIFMCECDTCSKLHCTPSATWKTPESSSSRLKRRPPMSDTGGKQNICTDDST